ncbi:LapA family protein [Pseudoalteromonas sp. NZS127_1]|uniref:LapA family protein n=1 Tax=Pseudoalteromonas arctica TaxID=394751 RepID=A0A7X9YEA1_9GAMM|nr:MULTISPECIES: LapA family protein [Pseudoalteromonas]KAA1155354.1 LapA family protein [Pseudoalteromonas sp. FUC4]MBG9993868.1 LapA family protein [Pseudoalteromonas sp. NZS127_1]MBH0025628.1 LapA family protein [Pseudoalteromonas sp. SWN29]MBH0039681.1 LapA family protein [Pseudoalteromonas sp. SWN166]MBH0041450.1 LapA family protein [Pseudoalteromonas sp. SWXJZ10B]
MFKVLKIILVALCLISAFVLGSQNPQLVQINYIIASNTLPLAVIISICFLLGVLIGCFISFKLFSQLKWQNYRLKKQLAPEKDKKKLAANKDT